jgi:cysteine sulfinate desulfinase/cysteine desulfurase-like protein
MGLAADDALQTVRLSAGTTTTAEEIDAAAEALLRGYRALTEARR